jgi:spore maturation protein CgeB
VLSDWWEGLDQFYEPGAEILIARTPEDSVAAMELSDEQIRRIALAARERTLAEHTSDQRARDLEDALEDCTGGDAPANTTAATEPAELEKA